jgi:GMP synthase-like glutamine amidotransferase
MENPCIGYHCKTILTVNALNDHLFKNMTIIDNLLSFHTDAIKIPHNAPIEILGISSQCLPHIIKYNDGPIYGVQFHPEVNINILSHYLDMKCGVLIDSNHINKIIDHASKQERFNVEGTNILKNWLHTL